MTHEAFYISDHHFSHAATWEKFKRSDGSPLRDFDSTESMDEHMIKCWNSVVRPQDSVYHCGDFVMNRKFLHIAQRLNGHKKLIRGNHDQPFSTKELLDAGFEEIYGVYVDIKRQFILSHVPLHPESLGRWGRNVHGHLHYHTVKVVVDGKEYDDPRYLNVSVENVNYTPINLDQVNERFQNLRDQRSKWPFDKEAA
jgi:calcineurin-like phosphoesterase family protein